MAINYEKAARLHKKQKSALTRAVNSGKRENVLKACSAAVAEWNEPDMSWPDDWSRWQRALEDMYPVFDGPRLEDL